jgi:hypothetical protein
VVFNQSFGRQKFSSVKVGFCRKRFFRQSQVSEIDFKVFNQRFGEFGSGFWLSSLPRHLSGSFFLAKVLVCKVIFSACVLVNFALAFLFFLSFGSSKVSIAKNFVTCKIKSLKGWVLVFS